MSQPCQKPSTANSDTSASLSQFVRLLFNGFLSRLVLLVERERLLQSPQGLPFSTLCLESSMPLPTEAFPPTTASSSTDCGLPHHFLQLCGPWISTQPLDAAQNMDLKYGPSWQYRPETFAWLPAIAGTMDINTANSFSISHRYGHGLRWQQRPQTSA